MYKRLLAVGDIHGCYDMFMDLWQKVAFNPEEDMVVFLGDYIDRGPDSAKMMEWVMAHQNQPNMVFLRGNHEGMMDEAFHPEKVERHFFDDPPEYIWKCNGGHTTLASMYKEDDFNGLLKRWLDAIMEMPLYKQLSYSLQQYIFVHGNFYPGTPLENHQPDDLYWARNLAEYPAQYHGKAVAVFGHTPVQRLNKELLNNPKPLVYQDGHIILMDTGSYLPQGRISCMDLLNGQVWQSRANSKKWSDVK